MTRRPPREQQSVDAEVSHYAFLADTPEFAEVRERVGAEDGAFLAARL